ncbi:MAG: PKD domain-containing protein [Candidatus Zixiibacteriota bacterium]
MNFKLVCTTLFALALLTVSASAQRDPEDLGPNADTVALVTSVSPSANPQQLNVQVDLYMYTDATVKGASMGWNWDNPNLQMDSAHGSPAINTAFDLGRFFYEDGQIATTNANQRFLFGAARLFQPGLTGDTTGRRLWASYFFTLSNWSVCDTIQFDTNQFNSGSIFKMVNANSQGYIPVWEGGIEILDPMNADSCGAIVIDPPVIDCPPVAVSGSVCPGDLFKMALPITGATSVTVLPQPGGGWINDTLSITPDTSGIYGVTVIATNDGGADTCMFSANITVNTAPVIACPAPVNYTGCIGDVVCTTVDIVGADSVFVSGGSYVNGQVCITLPATTATLYAFNSCGTDSCTVVLNASWEGLPVITCPQGPIDVALCLAGEVCVNLPIANSTAVTASFGTWANDALCFQADTTGSYVIAVVAENNCGNMDSCSVTVNVTISGGGGASIACPVDTASFDLCGGSGEITVPLVITGADSVVVKGTLGSWANDVLTMTINNPGLHGRNIIAYSDCGNDTCEVWVNVNQIDPPVIACPAPVDYTGCIGDVVCTTVDIVGADSVFVSGGSYVNGQVCITLPDTTATLYAFNSCGSDSCDVAVNASIFPSATISCPTGPIDWALCDPGAICITIPVSNAASTTTSFGSWGNNTLCFQADTSGTYVINLTAVDSCDVQVECIVTVNVTIGNGGASIACPTDTASFDLCGGVGDVDVPLVVTGADSVVAPGPLASWANNVLTMTARNAGVMSQTVIAYSDCGNDTCVVTINVNQIDPPVIACPQSELIFDLCVLDTILIPIDIANADQVSTSQDFWEAGQLHFMPLQAGTHTVDIIAGNGCGDDTCQVTITVNLLPSAAIECPIDPITALVCRDSLSLIEVCVDLPISGADSVSVSSGTWANGQLCFFTDVEGDFVFMVHAFSACGTDTCQVRVSVGMVDRPVADFTAQPDSGGTPLTVSFTNASTPCCGVTWNWDLGDGTTSTDAEPVHTYTAPGCYDVTLIVENECAADTLTIVDAVCLTDTSIVIATNEWINIYCGNPTLDGVPLSPGDIITAFDPDGVLCGMGVVAADGSYGFIPIYRDDQFTPGDEGADPGDIITVKINGQPVLLTPELVWTKNGDGFAICDFSTDRCKVIHLTQGWNLISWNVQYSAPIQDLLAGRTACFQVVLGFDQGAQTYDPNLPDFSTLHDVDYYHGYWFKMACDVDLEICGLPIEDGDYIQVYNGWNLVSYWPSDTRLVEDALAGIIDHVQVVLGYDGGGLVWLPGQDGFNTLETMSECFGYWIKSDADLMLDYSGTLLGPIANTGQPQATSLGVTPSRTWMSVYGSNITVDGKAIDNNAVIEIYTEAGVLAGHGEYVDSKLKFTAIYGQDDMDDFTAQYPSTGDRVSIHIDGVATYPEITFEGEGSRVRLGALSTSEGDGNALPTSYSLAQNYPNPFNPTTVISFTLPTTGHVELSVYNVLGQKIRTLAAGEMTVGEHQVTWDATDDGGNEVSTGMYFYRLETGDFSETRKMVLMK